ncbi:hypothetical protein HPB48_012588 [Haemaphysalis longicornis]|uniref:ubiquitinyl hydrolase 1 n=1 Tax=Haemaphysalis longicornis TaxID=44386 RepID=A0A9J6GP76_HAELO|nr:hypothetical protein HPB48_012588 [Haemaphysalis longicornis]
MHPPHRDRTHTLGISDVCTQIFTWSQVNGTFPDETQSSVWPAPATHVHFISSTTSRPRRLLVGGVLPAVELALAPKPGHAQQEGSLCAQHCLNGLLQGEYFTAVDLAAHAQQIDEQERQTMAEGGLNSDDYQQFMHVRLSRQLACLVCLLAHLTLDLFIYWFAQYN